MKKTAALFIICVLIAGLFSFSGCKTSTAAEILTGVKWMLETIHYSPQVIVQIEKTFSLLFHLNGEVDMEVDCNYCGGTYITGSNNSIAIYTTACSEAHCGQASKDREFHAALDSAFRYEIENNSLYIYFNNGRLEFAAQ